MAGNTILGNEITAGSFYGSLAGGLLGSQLPLFMGVKGGALSNISAEFGYAAARGAVTGGVTGGVSSVIDNGNFRNVGRGIVRGAYTGVIGGAAVAGLNIATMGHVYNKNLTDEEIAILSKFTGLNRDEFPVIRRGHLPWAGIAVGPNASGGIRHKNDVWAGSDDGYRPKNYDAYTSNRRGLISVFGHEIVHYTQMLKDGFATYYGGQFADYVFRGDATSGYYEAPAYKTQGDIISWYDNN